MRVCRVFALLAVGLVVGMAGPAARADEAGQAGGLESDSTFVIPAGYEPFFLSMADPKALGVAGLKLEGIAIGQTFVRITWHDRSDNEIRVRLEHPSCKTPDARTAGRFDLIAETDPAAAGRVVRALAKRLAAKDKNFQWMRSAHREPPPGITPLIPRDALPASRVPEPTLDLGTPSSEALFARAIDSAASGDQAEARKLARELWAGEGSPLAAASVLRRIGDGTGAVELLGKALAGRSGWLRPDLDRAASFLLAGAGDDARKVLAERPNPLCDRAMALTWLLQEGRIAEVGRLALDEPSEGPVPRCIHLVRMRAAFAARDDDAFDRASRAAIQDVGDDEDLLFLWGEYYVTHHFFEPALLGRALEPWERLVRKNPRYPGLLGLFGTVAVQSRHLDGKRSFEYLEKWKKDNSDVVSAILAGIGLHYVHEYAPSIPALEVVHREVPEEPRGGMYLAMAYFFTGRQKDAEDLLESLEKYGYQEPDIYYCRSMVHRRSDRERAIREMEKFLEVMKEEGRFCFNPAKPAKARADLEALRRGEIPDVHLPGPTDDKK
jgi:hypothetical protein